MKFSNINVEKRIQYTLTTPFYDVASLLELPGGQILYLAQRPLALNTKRNEYKILYLAFCAHDTFLREKLVFVIVSAFLFSMFAE